MTVRHVRHVGRHLDDRRLAGAGHLRLRLTSGRPAGQRRDDRRRLLRRRLILGFAAVALVTVAIVALMAAVHRRGQVVQLGGDLLGCLLNPRLLGPRLLHERCQLAQLGEPVGIEGLGVPQGVERRDRLLARSARRSRARPGSKGSQTPPSALQHGWDLSPTGPQPASAVQHTA